MSKYQIKQTEKQTNIASRQQAILKIAPLTEMEIFRISIERGLVLDNNLLISAVNKNNIGIVKEIIDKKNWDINITNNKGQTLLHVAIINGNLEMIKLLVEKGANIEKEDYYGQTAIQASISNHFANAENKIAIIEFLLSQKPNLHHQDKDQKSIMDLARAQNKEELKEKIVSILEIAYIPATNDFLSENPDNMNMDLTGETEEEKADFLSTVF